MVALMIVGRAAIPSTGSWKRRSMRSSRSSDEWAEIDHSHRKLAHRGSYVGRVWVSPSTAKRVLAAKGLHLRGPKRSGTSAKRPWPDWVSYQPNEMWIYDTTHFTRCGAAVVVIVDMVSRKWLATVVSTEETSTQVQAVFGDALDAEGITAKIDARYDELVDLGVDDERRPILLAISDIHSGSGADRCSRRGDGRRFDRDRCSLVVAARPTGAVRRPLAC